MTTLNTIIEEEEKEFDELYGWVKPLTLRLGMWSFTATAMQRAYEAGKADWLRSEIEKLEGMKHKCPSIELGCRLPETREHDVRYAGYNESLTSIITRYKEELKVLEKGI